MSVGIIARAPSRTLKGAISSVAPRSLNFFSNAASVPNSQTLREFQLQLSLVQKEWLFSGACWWENRVRIPFLGVGHGQCLSY